MQRKARLREEVVDRNASSHGPFPRVVEQAAGGVSGRGLVVAWPLGLVHGGRLPNDPTCEWEPSLFGSNAAVLSLQRGEAEAEELQGNLLDRRYEVIFASADDIVAAKALDEIAAAKAVDHIVAGSPVQHVVAGGS